MNHPLPQRLVAPLVILLAGITASALTRPPIDIDATIRGDARLSTLDRQLGDVVTYASRPGMPGAAAVPAGQRGWLAARAACLSQASTADCLAGRYALRIADLSAASGWPPARPPIRLRCDGDPPLGFTITYYATVPGTLVAERRGERIAMLEQSMASGVRYQGGGASYAEHQDEAAITWPGQKQLLRCLWR